MYNDVSIGELLCKLSSKMDDLGGGDEEACCRGCCIV